MKRINFLIVIVCIFAFSEVFAQDAFRNESKYWFYRYRLLTEFLAHGEDQCGSASGFSIPCDKGYLTLDDDYRIRDENNVTLDLAFKYGDGTSFLGCYIGVLATEHKLLRNGNAPNWQVDKVKGNGMFKELDLLTHPGSELKKLDALILEKK